MSQFFYTSSLPTGERRQGVIEAESIDAARWLLLEKGLRPEQLQAATQSQTQQNAQGKTGLLSELDPRNWGRVKSVHIELTLRQLSVMLRSGLNLLSAIDTIIELPPSRAVRRCYLDIREKVESGSSLADAISEHKGFPKSVVAMVGLGEESGNLDVVMRRSAESMESIRQNRNAMITALFYPTFTLLFALGICVYMIVAVIPPMKQALDALGRPLPAMTQSLLDLSELVVTYGPHFFVVLVTIVIAFTFVWLWPPGRLGIDRILLRLPLIGTILRCGGTALFARSMATLLESGIRLVEGLRILSRIHGNLYFAQVVDSARNRVLEGGTLADSLGRGNAYTPMMIKMVGVGESSGNLVETLENVADFHDERLQTLIKQLSAMIEPAIVLIVGGLVGYIYIAFFVGLYGAM
ncbi:type II secretion system F family protein [Rubellicoccus peritrichatus]|uniref:Type II secretion system F family protein n=1 Tax=Rubellicoccus peritrichatus TaxID=3080537 RepID=A0AAQ3L5P2_9BACT|nr:type II secretion system F family protein [Puniceicoccus sp. CR14]WOO39491.1 type II secretion system F family protein [Puniceicoccus sp. CR14]